MTSSTHEKLIAAGYAYCGRTEAGEKYVKDDFSVYYSGSMLIFLRSGGMARPFREDRLCFFSVSDLERQTGVIPRPYDGKEDRSSYEIQRRF